MKIFAPERTRCTEFSESVDLKIVDVTVKQDMLVVIVRKHDPFVQSAVKKRRCLFIEVEGSVKPDEDGDAIVEFLKSNT